MPFESEFDDIYQLGIKQSCLDAGAYCERVDEQLFNESILERIFNQISKADIIIADMTNRNPNVFYEVGYAHALGKTTILLTQKAEDIPFDLKHFPHIIYGSKIGRLKKDLTTKVKWCVENTSSTDIDLNVGIDLFLNSDNLSNSGAKYSVPSNKYPKFKLTLHNTSFVTYAPGDYQVAVITSSFFERLQVEDSRTTSLPDGRLIHRLPIKDEFLYPDAYSSINLMFMHQHVSIYSEEIIIRLYTNNGARDYYLTIEKTVTV
jgi:hypothetical protein